MIERDRLYNEPEDLKLDPENIVGPISRADNRGGAIRNIEYFGTQNLNSGSSATFRPLLCEITGPPDFWCFYLMAGDTGSLVTLTEEGYPDLLFYCQQSAGVAAGTPLYPVTLKLPGRSRQVTIANTSTGLGALNFVAAAIWGYDPKDIF